LFPVERQNGLHPPGGLPLGDLRQHLGEEAVSMCDMPLRVEIFDAEWTPSQRRVVAEGPEPHLISRLRDE
jgi:hypothetical protein